MTFNLPNDRKPILVTDAETATFNALYKANWKELCLFAFRITGSKEVAQDMVQEVFVDLLEKYEGRQIQNLQAYLKQSVRYQCLNWIRNNKIRSEHLDRMKIILETNNIEESIDVSHINDTIKEVLERLPERCREVYTMSRSEGFTNQEIANKLEININTVENHLTKALRAIRLKLRMMIWFL
jgi:RNA polymerase sigma-70 factor (family 1)